MNRVLTELVSKMKDMQMDKSELGCLRAIVLINPGDGVLLGPLAMASLQGPGVLWPSSSAETERGEGRAGGPARGEDGVTSAWPLLLEPF